MTEIAIKRLWSKVTKADGCWFFDGELRSDGYCHFWTGVRDRPAHRVVYEQTFGQLDSSLVLDHLCLNKWCCSPYHLEPVTNRVNVLRGCGPTARNAAKTHCINGHAFADDNLVRWNCDNVRRCRACLKANWTRANARRSQPRVLATEATGVADRKGRRPPQPQANPIRD